MYLKIFFVIFGWIFSSAYCATTASQDECLLQLPKLSFFAPLVYTLNGVLISSEVASNNKDVLRISANEKVILSCSPNYFKEMPEVNSIEATCVNDQTLLVNGTQQLFRKNLECEVRAIEEILTPVSGCPNELVSVEYGFTNPINNKSYVLGEACFDESLGKTLFVHTTYKSDYKNYDLDKVILRTVNNVEHFKRPHPDSRFKLEILAASRLDTLQERLGEIYGTDNIPNLVSQRFIGRELLLNYQFYNVMKLGWNYVFINGAEVADSIESILNQVKLNLKFEEKFDIYIGTHGILSVPNKQKLKINMYMKDGKFPIAKYIWIVVVLDNKAVVYIVPNEPSNTIESNVARIELCENKCKSPLYCCSLADFQRNVPEMPKLNASFDLLF